MVGFSDAQIIAEVFNLSQIMTVDRPAGIKKTLWPSGLRRNVKAVVFIGVGSNPTGVTFDKIPFHFGWLEHQSF